MEEDTQRQWAERTVRILNRVFPEVEFSTWQQCQRYLPHAQVSTMLIKQWDIDFPEKVVKIVVHGLAQLLGSKRLGPTVLGVSQRPDLGNDVQFVRVGVQGFLDDLVGDVRAVEVAGVNMSDTQFYRLTQYGHGSIAVGWWTEHVRASQLHRTVPPYE
jgi:hypothetical protein